MMSKNMDWSEMEKIHKQRGEKYKDLVEVKEQEGKWFVFCKEHKKIVSPWSAFATSSFYESIDKGLEKCHGTD